MLLLAPGILGARLFAGLADSTSIGWIVRAGKDFPISAKKRLDGWKTTLLFKAETDKVSTRGYLRYKDELGSTSPLVGKRRGKTR